MALGRQMKIVAAAAAVWAGLAAVVLPATAQDSQRPAVQATPVQVAAWRVECTGDGKTLDCQALQQLVGRQDNRQGLLALLSARLSADTHLPVMNMQLPLGINVAEPVLLKIDANPPEKFPLQTCTGSGCFATVPLNDKLIAALRGGTTLKITVQDTSKQAINIDVPLLGFGLAFDKATK